jgi:hypothetical protein
MKNKMGRPPMPKGTAKKIVVAAKLSSEDVKAIEGSIKQTGQKKSEWIRGALHEAVAKTEHLRASKSIPGGANEEIEFQAIVMDKDGQPISTVQATLLPQQNYGEFLLFSSKEIHSILTKAVSLQMPDGKQLELRNLRRASGNFPVVRGQPPIEACFEFDY